MSSEALKQFCLHSIGGGWGQDAADQKHTERVAIIRGTDIPRLAQADTSTVPVRWETMSKVKSRLLQAGDIVVEVSGGSAASGQHTGRPLLITAEMLNKLENRVIPASFCRLLRLDTTRIDPQYILYQIQGLHLSGEICEFENQSTGIANFQFTRFLEDVSPLISDISVQKNIAQFLGSLDDRITLLRETNATLESIAQVIFKSWFIDFDPVKAKQEGQQPQGIDAATAAHFPDAFQDSEIGPIPEGCCISSVYDLAQYINGAAYKAFEPNLEKQGLPIIKIAELKAGVTAQTAFSDVEMPSKYKISSKDILFSWSGNPDTSIDVFVWSHGKAWLNQHIFRVIPSSEQDRSFVLLMLKILKPVFSEIARNKQTTGLGHVTVADLKRLQVIKPNNILLREWNKIVDPLLDQAFVIEKQIQTLTSIRDTLLPRLISGKLRLPEAEEMAEEAGL